jgi:hypothetical protein
MKGIKRSIPPLLVESLAKAINKQEDFDSLKKFWLKCCLNPNAQSAEDLYAFLHNHQFKIDKHGNFYAYRRVVSKANENRELVEFVSNTYTKVRAIWNKKTSNYEVYKTEDGGFGLTENVAHPSFQTKNNTVLGNLEQLYKDLPSLQSKSYTSAHTGREDYRVGEVHSMPRQSGDDNNTQSCSRGFHAASKAYDYSGFGDTPILVIINPMDVLAVPHGEVGKLRTCRWFFATVLKEDEKHILDDDMFSVTDLGDVFEEKCLANLQAYVQNSFAEEVQRHTFSLAPINYKEVSHIVYNLERMKEILKNRVEIIAD